MNKYEHELFYTSERADIRLKPTLLYLPLVSCAQRLQLYLVLQGSVRHHSPTDDTL